MSTTFAGPSQKANDFSFEEVLIGSEYNDLLAELDAEKGQFLRQLNKAIGASLFDLLKDPTRAQKFPLLQLEDQEITTRMDCDPQWIKELICDVSADAEVEETPSSTPAVIMPNEK